ncbi:hypothetical protein LEMA_P016620.1 [Plenodomus lingam JN3]|uniref:Uncharacterized protein n=2 Tax=Leptosphaeria maculans TaxID=5022 RepID=E5AA41_LEPMJ|nr:hypothetical protein LEMA_P016620.1 [Plenodomus lingam JN3]CBY00532.1 hypothetical protein LEMA_P016620.1 [Plenodomus lingam JN3]
MSSNIISATVAADSAQFQVFPNEILIKIMVYLLARPDGSAMGDVDHKHFPLLFIMGMFKKMRYISRTFNDLAIMAFYEANKFKFIIPHLATSSSGQVRMNDHVNVRSALLPPMAVRGYLRHISIDLVLQDHFKTSDPSKPNNSSLSIERFFANPSQLFAYSPCARQLRDLTQSMFGLEVLNLNITTWFVRPDRKAAIAVFKAAKFEVKAGKVNVVIKDHIERATQEWHSELVQAITGQ